MRKVTDKTYGSEDVDGEIGTRTHGLPIGWVAYEHSSCGSAVGIDARKIAMVERPVKSFMISKSVSDGIPKGYEMVVLQVATCESL